MAEVGADTRGLCLQGDYKGVETIGHKAKKGAFECRHIVALTLTHTYCEIRGGVG